MDRESTTTFVRLGLVASLVTAYLAAVGMLLRFGTLTLVGEQITLGRVLLGLPPLVAAYVAARPRVRAGELVTLSTNAAVAAGSVTGLVAGVVVGALLWGVDVFGIDRVRAVFLQISQPMLDFLWFGTGAAVGLVILSAGAAALGALGGYLRVMEPQLRRLIIGVVTFTLLIGLLQRIVRTAMLELGVDPGILYGVRGGLSWAGGVIVAVVTALVMVGWRRRGADLKTKVRETANQQPGAKVLFLAVALAVMGAIPLVVGSSISQVLGTVAVFLLLGLGLNIVVGYAGLLDLGYVAFFAFGAYATAILTGATLNSTEGAATPVISFGLSFYVALPIVVVLAAGVGLLIGAPVLRLRGDYLAIVTLGLGEMASVLISSRWAQPLVGGPQGMRGVSDAGIFGFSFRDPQHFYYLALAFVILAAFVSHRLANSRVGRAWNAMREDEQVADAMGISTTRYKLLAFALGGAIGSVGGALFAVQIGSLTPRSFTILVSITALAVVILGGMGSLPGVIVGGLVLIGLPGLLREFEEYRLLVYGGVLVAIMVLRPEGLVPNVRRSRELHDEERSQDQWAKALEEAAAAEDESAAVAGEVQP